MLNDGNADRSMRADETVYIFDFEGRTLEIVGGRNASIEDDCSYTVSVDGAFVHRVGGEGFVEETYDAHSSKDEIELMIRGNAP
jgi:hypothetical protein